MKILLVEDHNDVARVSSSLLREAGNEVEVAYTGVEAIDLARQFLPEIVLLDLKLPDMDGFKVFEVLRNDPCCHSIPIIALTGSDVKPDGRFEAFLTKPVTLEELNRVMSKLHLA